MDSNWITTMHIFHSIWIASKKLLVKCDTGSNINIKTIFPVIGILTIKIRWSWDLLNRLGQDCSYSISNILELSQSCGKPSILRLWWEFPHWQNCVFILKWSPPQLSYHHEYVSQGNKEVSDSKHADQRAEEESNSCGSQGRQVQHQQIQEELGGICFKTCSRLFKDKYWE